MKYCLYLLILFCPILSVADDKSHIDYYFHINIGELEFHLFRVTINDNKRDGKICFLSTLDSIQINDDIGQKLLKTNNWSKFINLEKDRHICSTFLLFDGIETSFFVHNLKHHDIVYSFFYKGIINKETLSGSFYEYTSENVNNKLHTSFDSYLIDATSIMP